MSSRLKLITFLLAWFIATGAQWDVVQTFGWMRMVHQYAKTMPLSEAVKKTFSGETCGVCIAVSHAKQDAANSAVAPDGAKPKLVMIAPASPLVLARLSLVVSRRNAGDIIPRSHGRGEPPTPPPRAA